MTLLCYSSFNDGSDPDQVKVRNYHHGNPGACNDSSPIIASESTEPNFHWGGNREHYGGSLETTPLTNMLTADDFNKNRLTLCSSGLSNSYAAVAAAAVGSTIWNNLVARGVEIRNLQNARRGIGKWGSTFCWTLSHEVFSKANPTEWLGAMRTIIEAWKSAGVVMWQGGNDLSTTVEGLIPGVCLIADHPTGFPGHLNDIDLFWPPTTNGTVQNDLWANDNLVLFAPDQYNGSQAFRYYPPSSLFVNLRNKARARAALSAQRGRPFVTGIYEHACAELEHFTNGPGATLTSSGVSYPGWNAVYPSTPYSKQFWQAEAGAWLRDNWPDLAFLVYWDNNANGNTGPGSVGITNFLDSSEAAWDSFIANWVNNSTFQNASDPVPSGAAPPSPPVNSPQLVSSSAIINSTTDGTVFNSTPFDVADDELLLFWLEADRTDGVNPTFPTFAFTAGSGVVPAVPTRYSGSENQWSTTAQKVEHVALTAAQDEAGRLVRDGMLEGYRGNFERFTLEKTYRFPVLAHWSFTVNGVGGFESLMRGLDVGLLGTAPAEPVLPPGAPPAPPLTRPAPEFTETGHVGLPHLTRRGDRVRAWYRGPLGTYPTTRDQADAEGRLALAHVSDQLRRSVPDGREDLSLAAAFEIGRLLALSQPSVVRALLAWRAEQFGAARAKAMLAVLSDAPKLGAAIAGAVSGTRLADLLSKHLVLEAAAQPDRVFAPSRPLVDPGRPLPFAREGGLDKLISEGFGFSAAQVKELRVGTGTVAALQRTAVPVASVGSDGPLLEGVGADRLRASLTALARLVASVSYTEEEPAGKGRQQRVVIGGLFEFFDIARQDLSAGATLRYGLNRKLVAVIDRSARWGRIKAEVFCAMRSRYAIALYEALALRRNMDRCIETLPIDKFRELLAVKADTYKIGTDFQRFVIDPAVLEVNGLSDLGVKIEIQRKHGRAPIHAVTIAWWKKSASDLAAAVRERNRSKIGRMARLKGAVEIATPHAALSLPRAAST